MAEKRSGSLRRPTIRQVADAAEVSLGTVSRVLNAHKSVSAETRRRVEDTIRRLGYEPDSVAQSMRNRTTHTIGCIIRDITIPGLASFVKAAQDELHEAGYFLMVANSGGRREHELELMSLFSRRRADGLILSLGSEEDPTLIDAIREFNFPVVLMDRETPKWADSVIIDHASGMRRGVEHLLKLGHRRIALITGKSSLHPARQRILGYRQAHEALGVPIDPELVRSGSFLPDYGFRETSALLASKTPPTAVISGGMDMLSGVLRALRVHNVNVPQDLSLLACSDSELAELVTPAVTVVRWDLALAGRFTARALVDRLKGSVPSEARSLCMPTELVLRSSCVAPRG